MASVNSKTGKAMTKNIGDDRHVRRFVRDVREYCRVFESHCDREVFAFLSRCEILVARLYATSLELPGGVYSKSIVRRQETLRDALSFSEEERSEIIGEQAVLRDWQGTLPTTRDSAAQAWLLEAMQERLRKSRFRRDALFRSFIPFEVHWEMYESCRSYLGGMDQSWFVFNPLEKEEPICSSLADGLCDIWSDLKSVLGIFDVGSERAKQHAVWSWQFDAEHWGCHARTAMNAINWLLKDRRLDATYRSGP